MEEVGAMYPNWQFLRTAIPSEPAVFTSVANVPVREYEAALLKDLSWPTSTTPREKAPCVRVMATQLLPFLTEYTQFRDHIQSHLGKMHTWFTEVLMPNLQNMEKEMHILKLQNSSMENNLHSLKLQLFVLDQSGAPRQERPSAAPSLISAPSSVAESIAEAQAVAASLRSQGPAAMFSYPDSQEQAGPNEGQGQHGPDQGQAGPNPGHDMQAYPNQGQMWLQAHGAPVTILPTYMPAILDPNQGQEVQAHASQGQMWLQAHGAPATPAPTYTPTIPNQEGGLLEQSQTGQRPYRECPPS